MPPDASWRRTCIGREKTAPSRSRSSEWTAPTLRGPMVRRSTDAGWKASSRAVAAGPGVRRESSRLRRPPSRRRSANDNVAADDGSIHWSSSIASSTVRSFASTGSNVAIATPSARASTGRLVSSRISSADSKAWRRGAASATSSSGPTSWNRSPRTTLASTRSVSAGRDASTVKPRSRAAATAAIQSVDFPIPAAPSMTSARGPAADRSRNASIAEDSASRPTIAPITP